MQRERIRRIMSEAVLSIGVHEPVSEALRLFADYPVHHLPVVDQSGLVGMLSSADMLKLQHFMPKSDTQTAAALLNDRFRIESMMRRPVISTRQDDTIADAAAAMATHGVHALPVVNEDNHLVGIVTTTDIVSALLHGVGPRPGPGQHAARRPPTELEVRHAIEAAESATLNGTDADGIAAWALYLHERNALLEELRQDVARYLRSGQDEQLHARLLQVLDRLESHAELATRP
jgi:CBS domain-containing protein